MSNSFPSMICNEPPPLDQSDEDDEDSEDFRDFATGLKLDVDPSPMSTPRKGENSTPAVPVRAEDSSPDISHTGNVTEKLSDRKIVDNHSLDSSQVGHTPNPPINSVMKTSYIGTVELDPEPEPVELEASRCIEVDSFMNMSHSEVVTLPAPTSESQIQISSDSNQSVTDDDDFDDFQDFQTTAGAAVDSVVDNVVEYNPEDCGMLGDSSKTELSIESSVLEDAVQDVAEPCPNLEFQYEDASSIEPSCDPVPTTALTDGDIFEDAEPLPNIQVPATVEDIKVEFETNFAAFGDAYADDDFDNFQDFQSSGLQQTPAVQCTVPEETVSGFNSELSLEVAQGLSGIDSSDIPENNSETSIPTALTEVTAIPLKLDPPLENSSSSNFNSFSDDEDFDDFQAFQSTPTSITSIPSSTKIQAPIIASTATAAPPESTVDFSSFGTASKLESLVKSLFVPSSTESSADSIPFCPIDKQLKEQAGNEQWNQVEDFEASQGLLFKWLNSVAYQRFLKSLKIDNSTIVYTDKWGAIEVPRFAASLVDSPLQPETGSKTSTSGMPLSKEVSPVRYLASEQSSSDHESTNGVVISNTAVSTTGAKTNIKVNGSQLSLEAEQILNQLPDLSFMRAKNLVFPNTASTSHVISSDV